MHPPLHGALLQLRSEHAPPPSQKTRANLHQPPSTRMPPSLDTCRLRPLLPPGEELRSGPRWRDEADLEVAPARVRDAEPHHDVLQVEHVLVAVLGAGAAESAGAQHVARSDVPAGYRASRWGQQRTAVPSSTDAQFQPYCFMVKIISSSIAIQCPSTGIC